MYALFLKFYFLESIVFCDIFCTLIDLVVIQYLQSKDDSDDSSDESDEEPALKKPKEFLVFAFSSEDFGLYCISYSIPGFIFWWCQASL